PAGVDEGRGWRWGPSSGTASTGRGRRGPRVALGAVERHRLDRPGSTRAAGGGGGRRAAPPRPAGVDEGRGWRWGPSSGTASTGRGRRGPRVALGAVERHRLDRPGSTRAAGGAGGR